MVPPSVTDASSLSRLQVSVPVVTSNAADAGPAPPVVAARISKVYPVPGFRPATIVSVPPPAAVHPFVSPPSSSYRYW